LAPSPINKDNGRTVSRDNFVCGDDEAHNCGARVRRVQSLVTGCRIPGNLINLLIPWLLLSKMGMVTVLIFQFS
jgi:hypothetical protein